MMTSSTLDRYAGVFTPTSTIVNNGNGGNDIKDGGLSATMDAMTTMTTIVTPGFETTSLLSTIHPTSIDQIGSDAFMESYGVNLERLSVQAHLTASLASSVAASSVTSAGNNSNNSTPGMADVLHSIGAGAGGMAGVAGMGCEEYIVEAFLENPDKIEAIIETLLALEFWRTNVLFARGELESMESNNNNEAGESNAECGDNSDYSGNVDNNQSNQSNEYEGSERNKQKQTSRKGLATQLAANGNVVRVAFILHVETTIVSLLNLIFYRGVPHCLLDGRLGKVGSGGGKAGIDGNSGNSGKVSSGSGDEMLLSLIDYCARQLIYLGTPSTSNPSLHKQKHPPTTAQLATYLQSRTHLSELRDALYDSTYQTAIASVTLSRYICESVEELGPSLLSRVLDVHDIGLLMVALIEEPPWTRRRVVEDVVGVKGVEGVKGSDTSDSKAKTKVIWEKLNSHNEWTQTPPQSLLTLTPLEAQPWLTLHHLTSSPKCRSSYKIDDFRKSTLMRVRKFIRGVMVDQLPVLEGLMRYLDELSVLGVASGSSGGHGSARFGESNERMGVASSSLLLERVDVFRESIGVGVDGKRLGQASDENEFWEGIAKKQWLEIFSRVTDSKDEELKRIAREVYGGSGAGEIDEAICDIGEVVGGKHGMHAKDARESPNTRLESSKEEEWKIPLSKPIEKISLHLNDDNDHTLASFELIPSSSDGGTVTETPLGPFRRIKCSIKQISGEGDAVFPNAKGVASIHFQPETSHKTSTNAYTDHKVTSSTLSIASISLPTTQLNSIPNNYDELGLVLSKDHFPSTKEWRQIGDLQGKNIVLQLGFRRLDRGLVPAGCTFVRGYALSQAFVSQPVVKCVESVENVDMVESRD